MLRKSAAALLLLLIASPFTAPFETCDVSTLFGNHMPAAQYQYQDAFMSMSDQSAVAVAGSSRRARHRSRLGSPDVANSCRDDDPRGTVYVRVLTPAPAPALVALISHTPLRI
jgi:hypothetical protein